MNQRAGFEVMNQRKTQRQTSSGREALNPYREFSLFPRPLEEGGWCKFASCIHLFLCWKPPPCWMHILCYHFQRTILPIFKFSLNHIPTSPTHIHNQHSSELAGNLMRQALTRISCFWFSQTYCNNRHSRSILAPLLLVQAKTQECKWKKHFLIFRILK